MVALFEQTGSIDGTIDGDVAGLTPEERQLRQLRERYTTSVAVLSLDNPRVQVMKSQIDALEELAFELGDLQIEQGGLCAAGHTVLDRRGIGGLLCNQLFQRINL